MTAYDEFYLIVYDTFERFTDFFRTEGYKTYGEFIFTFFVIFDSLGAYVLCLL
jgi:hypothetical protein